MMRLDLTLFGGRGGDSTSARWMDGFFKAVSKGADGAGENETEIIKAAKAIYKALVREKISSSFFDHLYMPKERLLQEWTKTSNVAKYDIKSQKLTIEKGKGAEARREFENFIKNKLWKYYQKGKPKANRTPHIKK